MRSLLAGLLDVLEWLQLGLDESLVEACSLDLDTIEFNNY